MTADGPEGLRKSGPKRWMTRIKGSTFLAGVQLLRRSTMSSLLPRNGFFELKERGRQIYSHGSSIRDAGISELLVWTAYEILARATGKPFPAQRALFNIGGARWWALSSIMLFSNWIILVVILVNIPSSGSSGILLLPAAILSEIIVTGRLRAQQVVFAHHAVHGTISIRHPWINKFVKVFSTVVPLAQNPNDYRNEHIQKHHRTKTFTTIYDPDASFLHSVGFYPGRSKSGLYANFWITLISPRFHLLFAKARIRSSFATSSWTHKALALAWICLLAATLRMLPFWVFFTAVVLPLGPLYHISALLQFLTEHKWSMKREGPCNKVDYASRCVGRFSLIPMPDRLEWTRETILLWVKWCFLMCPELLVRIGSWVGDIPAHDHHHLVGYLGHKPDSWHEAIFERQRSIDEGDQAGLSHREVLGIRAALDWVFEGLSQEKD